MAIAGAVVEGQIHVGPPAGAWPRQNLIAFLVGKARKKQSSAEQRSF